MLRNALRQGVANVSRRSGRFRGKVRMLRLVDKILRPAQDRVTGRVGAANWVFETEDWIDFNRFYLGDFDPEVITVCSQAIAQGADVLWDVGANVGSISLPLLAKHRNLQVQAFEASPRVAARLHANVLMNPDLAERITVNAVALSARSGLIDFYSSCETENSGVGSMGAFHNTVSKPVRVVSYTGDEVIEAGIAPPPKLIKMDVEGFELAVLQGLQRFLSSGVALDIVFEHSPYRLDLMPGSTRTQVAEFLLDHGFSLHQIDASGGVSPCRLSHLERDENVNLLASRGGSREA